MHANRHAHVSLSWDTKGNILEPKKVERWPIRSCFLLIAAPTWRQTDFVLSLSVTGRPDPKLQVKIQFHKQLVSSPLLISILQHCIITAHIFALAALWSATVIQGQSQLSIKRYGDVAARNSAPRLSAGKMPARIDRWDLVCGRVGLGLLQRNQWNQKNSHSKNIVI